MIEVLKAICVAIFLIILPVILVSAQYIYIKHDDRNEASKQTYTCTGNIIGIPKIKNGSSVHIGKNRALNIQVDYHFNWFQKKMIRWCFGFEVEDYTEDGAD